MSMRLGCCCTTGDRCLDCEPVEDIACVKVTRSGWAQPRVVKGTWTELCGQGIALGTPCTIPEMGVLWKPDEADCNVVVFSLLFRGLRYTKCAGAEGLEEEITYPELRVVFSAPRNWYLTSASTTIGSETITIEVGDVALDTDISLQIHPDVYLHVGPAYVYVNAHGNSLCGVSCSYDPLANAKWSYDSWTDKIVVTGQRGFSGSWFPVFVPPSIYTLCAEIDYDNGDWILTDEYPATVVEVIGLAGATTTNTYSDTVKVVDACDYVPPSDQCLTDAAEGTITLDFTFTVDGTECSGWDAPLGPHSITAGAPWVYVSDATHYISKMRLILDNLNPGIQARLQILYTDDPANFEANMIEYTGTVDGECIDGQFFGSVVFTGPICASSSTAPVVTIDFTGPP